jgi:serralysin
MNRPQHARNFRRPLVVDELEGRQLLTGTALHGAAVSTLNALYSTMLDRQPDSSGLAGFSQALQGGQTLAQVTTVIATSPEYLGDNRTDGAPAAANNAQFVTALYNDVLGRAPDQPGLNTWVNALNTGAMTTAQVATSFVNSPESTSSPVSVLHVAAVPTASSLYSSLLHRQPDPGGLAGFSQAMQGGMTIAQAANIIVDSPEYLGRNITAGATETANHTQFVTALYNDVLGRAPDQPGLTTWVSLLNTGSLTTAQVATNFVYSPESIHSTS